MKSIVQKLLEFFLGNGGSHHMPYWTCSDKRYCMNCKYASHICMYGEDEEDYKDKIPCANAWLNKYFI